MTLFPTLPEPPPVPPWLRWNFADAVDCDDPATFAVTADVTQYANGWRWGARMWRYVTETRSLVELVDVLAGEPPRRVKSAPKEGGGGCDTRAEAMAEAEKWIVGEVADAG